MLYSFSIDDVALNDWSTPEHLNNIIEFCKANQINATYFVVPQSDGKEILSKNSEYKKLIDKIFANGSECAQHGITHDRFEIGVPPKMILDLPHEGPSREYLATHQEELKIRHSVENIKKQLQYGRDILEELFERKLYGFRSPALQVCDNFFIAMSEMDYLYDSSACLQETGWDYLQGNTNVAPREITKARFQALQKIANTPVLPLTTDYTWFIGPENYDITMQLAQKDFLSCLEQDLPFIHVAHVSPVQQGDNNMGFKFLSELINYMKKQTKLESLTLKEISETLL